MDKAFDKIQLIQGGIVAAWLLPEAPSGQELLGWCANSALAPETIASIGLSLDSAISRLRHRGYDSHSMVLSFGDRTIVARRYGGGLFFAWLDSPVDDSVLEWFWPQIESALSETNVDLELA